MTGKKLIFLVSVFNRFVCSMFYELKIQQSLSVTRPSTLILLFSLGCSAIEHLLQKLLHLTTWTQSYLEGISAQWKVLRAHLPLRFRRSWSYREIGCWRTVPMERLKFCYLQNKLHTKQWNLSDIFNLQVKKILFYHQFREHALSEVHLKYKPSTAAQTTTKQNQIFISR